ncbi:MAG TPA: HEAT repeat domain-containing protein [Candidatus Paceibacterota bacterium]|nr:HEAT repeat domain-containing protein [Candidatus Paceibacterota bacterium]
MTTLPAVAGVEQTVTDLLPRLAAAKVEDRYDAQMELQALAANAARPGAESERAELAGVLTAKATDAAVPQPAQVWVVRQLEYIGAAESVAALAALLDGSDVELKECARRALEKNPDSTAGDRLRAALQRGGEVNWRIGLIQSLGERRDSRAVELISGELSGKETAPVAASALGKIADAQAVSALWRAYDRGVVGAADGLVMAGNRLLSDGVGDPSAQAVFKRLYLGGARQASARDPIAPVQVRAAALIGWAKADPHTARPYIEAALRLQQPELQLAAVSAATAAFEKAKVGPFLVPLLPGLPSTAKTYALRVLDASAEKEIIAAASDPDESVQLAALERLGQIGSAASIPVLFQTAVAGSASARRTAAGALASISDRNAGAAIGKLAGAGGSRSRAVAMEALAARNDKTAAPALLKYAGEPDPAVSAAACAALARLGTDSELDGLIQLVLAGRAAGAAPALQAVAGRTTDKAAAAQKLIAQAQAAAPTQLAPLLEVLAVLGEEEALGAVSSFVNSSKAEIKDAAIRALANWPDFAANKELLAVAADPNTTRTHNVLAVQAVARLVKAADREPPGARVEVALSALNAARRDEEKKLLLSALASVPDKKAADAIKPYLRDPQFQQEAGLAAMTLAEALRKPDRPAARDLARAVKDANLSDELNRKANALLNKN